MIMCSQILVVFSHNLFQFQLDHLFSFVVSKNSYHVEAPCTGKSLSEAFILTSTDPQYDKRLFIDLPVQYIKTTSSEHGENMLCTQSVFFYIQNN